MAARIKEMQKGLTLLTHSPTLRIVPSIPRRCPQRFMRRMRRWRRRAQKIANLANEYFLREGLMKQAGGIVPNLQADSFSVGEARHKQDRQLGPQLFADTSE